MRSGSSHSEPVKAACRVEAWGLLTASFALSLLGMLTKTALGFPGGFGFSVSSCFSLASCFAAAGLTLLLSASQESSRLNRFVPAFAAWMIPATLAVVGLLLTEPKGSQSTSPLVSSLWMIFASAAAVLFIASRIAASRSGAFSLSAALLREQCILSLIAAFALISSQGQSSVPSTVADLSVRCWALAIAFEGLLRLAMGMLSGQTASQAMSSEFLLRQLVTGRTSAAIEQLATDAAGRDGADVSPETGRAISSHPRSIRVPLIGGVLATLLFVWSFSGLVIVQNGHRAAHYRLGHLQDDMLRPGMHLTLPFPFARTTPFSVKRLNAMTIGFVADPMKLTQQPMLWTKPHGEAEHPLIVGSGTELVAINAVVHYRVADDPVALKSYVTTARNHDAMLRNLAQHVLMSETRTLTLQGLLSTDRAHWGREILRHLQHEVARHQLGLEVVQFDVLSIHPPIDVADSFLEIVAARVDAEREVEEARGAYATERSRCEMMAATDAADARAAASVRLTAVMDEAMHLESLASVDDEYPAVFRRRAFCDAISEALADRTITLIDQKLPPDLKLWLGSQREIHPEMQR